MYHPRVCAANVLKLESAYGVSLQEHALPEIDSWTGRLADVMDHKGKPLRALTEDEEAWILNETLLCKVDFAYFATRYAKINVKGHGLKTMDPFLETQLFILKKMGALELATYQGERQDGILLNLLKGARQVGGSTLAECVIGHRVVTQANLFGLLASDVPGEKGSGYLFDMLERIIDSLPWWLAPELIEHVKNAELKTAAGCNIWVDAGKSMKGAVGARGQLGRMKNISLCHIS